MKPFSTIIYNVDTVTPERVSRGFVAIGHDGRIAQTGTGNPDPQTAASADCVIDGAGKLLMPGAIDCHVHFREPGLTHKATIASESRAAVAGGVTSFFDMPNTVPQTVTNAAVAAKESTAARDSLANYAFFIGATASNLDELLDADYTRVPGIKLFMGSSTGNMLVDNDDSLNRLFASAPAIIDVHAEDEATIMAARSEIESRFGVKPPVSLHSLLRPSEACVKATRRAVGLARAHRARLHIAHLTTAAELSLLEAGATPDGKLITAEVSPHHLLWTEDDYATKGSRIKMNPSVKSPADREALRRAVTDGRIDIVATDHAPHLPGEKDGHLFRAASGAPMVQFSLPVMLDIFEPTTVSRVMSANPARLFGIVDRGSLAPGNYADLVMVERLDSPHTITDDDVLSTCGWTPMDGYATRHKVTATWVNGRLIYDRGTFVSTTPGMQIRFNRH